MPPACPQLPLLPRTAGPRVLHMSGMYREAQQWLQKEYPYWNRCAEGRSSYWPGLHAALLCDVHGMARHGIAANPIT